MRPCSALFVGSLLPFSCSSSTIRRAQGTPIHLMWSHMGSRATLSWSLTGSPWHTSKQGTPQFFTHSLPYSHPSPDHFQPPPSCGLPSPDSSTVRERKLLQSLCREACSKAKDAGRHPSYVPLCLTLVHHYNLDVNSPVLSNGLWVLEYSRQPYLRAISACF